MIFFDELEALKIPNEQKLAIAKALHIAGFNTKDKTEIQETKSNYLCASTGKVTTIKKPVDPIVINVPWSREEGYEKPLDILFPEDQIQDLELSEKTIISINGRNFVAFPSDIDSAIAVAKEKQLEEFYTIGQDALSMFRASTDYAFECLGEIRPITAP